MIPSLRMTDFLRVSEAGSAAAAFALAGAKWAIAADPAAAFPYLRPMGGLRSFQALFTLTGADNVVGECNIYAVQRLAYPEPRFGSLPASSAAGPLWCARLYGSLTAITASALVGVSGKVVGDSERFADGASWALSNWGTYVETVYGKASAVLSPADNSAPATLIMPDFGDNWGWALDLRKTTATTINALIQNEI